MADGLTDRCPTANNSNRLDRCRQTMDGQGTMTLRLRDANQPCVRGAAPAEIGSDKA
jgi:hypothetical protein